MKKIIDWLIALAKRTPYSHLYHGDGTVYMRRYWLMPRFMLKLVEQDCIDDGDEFAPGYYELKPWARRLFSFRLHQIVTQDYDPHFHDHPWSFVSLVLRGGYMEHRPVSIEPCFLSRDEREDHYPVWRGPGDIAMRRCVDRHRISFVDKDTWTLVALGPKRHWWGFYTPAGKVYYRDYPSVHSMHARSEGT